jgi:acetolactate synthase small subunit
MNHTYTISLNAINGLGVLPRIALVFSRRRLKIGRLRMHESETHGLAHLDIVLDCDQKTTIRLIQQLRRIVEVADISVSHGDGVCS